MSKKLTFILLSLILLIAYIDLIDSCRQIDLAIEDSVRSKVNLIEHVDYSSMIFKYPD